jgi:hypothetical protein
MTKSFHILSDSLFAVIQSFDAIYVYSVADSVVKWRLKAPRAVRQQNIVMNPVGLGTKNHCAGEGQQQFSSQSVSSQMNPGPDLQLWGPRGNENLEAPFSNNKFRL